MKIKVTLCAITSYFYEGKVEFELSATFENNDWISIVSSYVDESNRKYTFDGAYDYDGSVYEVKWNGSYYGEVDEDKLREIVGHSVMDAIIDWYKKSLQIDAMEKSVHLENLVDVYGDNDIFTVIEALEQWNEEQILTID